MRFRPTPLEGVLLVEPEVFSDPRGFFMETYHAPKFAAGGIDAPFVQDNHSGSVRNTLRGLHYQLERPQGKLVRVVAGAVFDVAVDLRKGSPTFGRWHGLELSADNRLQLWIPPGFAHGFCVLSDTAEVIYKCTDVYVPGAERTLRWDDPDIRIAWPVAEPLLSEKDARAPGLKDLAGDLFAYEAPKGDPA